VRDGRPWPAPTDPVFILTHEPPDPPPDDGVYTFVTNGIEAALKQAPPRSRRAATHPLFRGALPQSAPAIVPASNKRPTSASESPSVSVRISSVCSPRSGARRTGWRGMAEKSSGVPGIR
jgi:hypothetical protein